MLISAKLKPLALTIPLLFGLAACSESTSSTEGPNRNSNTNVPIPIPDPGNGGGTNFNEAALLANLVDNVITPTFITFNQQASASHQQLEEYCGTEKEVAAGNASDQARLDALELARSSWSDTMMIWQQAEVMQMGPLADNDGSLRNTIYSWPAKSLCGVDQDTVYFEDGTINLDETKPYDIKQRTSTRRGLVSLEHLLFSDNLDHNCLVANDALADWNNRSDSERRVARCEFAIEVASDLIDNSQILLDRWQGDSGYAAELKNAGEPGNSFESPHQAVNIISDALFYVDKELKDSKLATPIGYISNSCGLEACPEDVESPIAAISLKNIRANLAAFEKLFTGSGDETDNAMGFDNFLDQQDGTDTKNLMLQGLIDSKAAIESMEGNLKEALTNEKEKVELTHAKVKDVTDQLKLDFINKLALELPQSSAGDND